MSYYNWVRDKIIKNWVLSTARDSDFWTVANMILFIFIVLICSICFVRANGWIEKGEPVLAWTEKS